MKATFVKHLGALRPADEAAEDEMQRLGQGEMCEVEIRKPRNIGFHRKFFALLSLVWKQLPVDDYPTVEDLLTQVKIVTGHYDKRFIQYEGKQYTILTPKSISFAAMDQAEFEDFYNRVADYIARDVLPGIEAEDLKQEVESLAGMRS